MHGREAHISKGKGQWRLGVLKIEKRGKLQSWKGELVKLSIRVLVFTRCEDFRVWGLPARRYFLTGLTQPIDTAG